MFDQIEPHALSTVYTLQNVFVFTKEKISKPALQLSPLQSRGIKSADMEDNRHDLNARCNSKGTSRCTTAPGRVQCASPDSEKSHVGAAACTEVDSLGRKSKSERVQPSEMLKEEAQG